MTRMLSSQGLNHDTFLWLINVASVYDLLTAEGSLMGIGGLTSREDCCLRESKEKVIKFRRLFVIFPCLPCTHRLGPRSSRIVHSFLTYPYSNVLGQTHHRHTFGSYLTRSSSTVRHRNSRSNSVEAVPPMLLPSFPAPIPSRAFAHPSLPCPLFAPKARAFTKHKEELWKCSD